MYSYSVILPNIGHTCSYRHADDVSGLTWGGVSYETEDARPSGEETVETVDISDGFDINATEVVMLSFQ